LALWGRPRDPVDPHADDQAAAIKEWLALRARVPGAAAAPAVGSYRSDPTTYASYLNCPADAYRTAARTLGRRIARFGAGRRQRGGGGSGRGRAAAHGEQSLREPGLGETHASGRRLLSLVRVRLRPEERLREAAAALLRADAGKTLEADLDDYLYMLDHSAGAG